MSKFKVGDKVRVLHTDYPGDIDVGDVVRVVYVDAEGGVGLARADGKTSQDGLYFYDSEVEPAGEAPSTDLDAIIAKLERIKALRTELGL